jgi:HK97 family phage major capsid protein
LLQSLPIPQQVAATAAAREALGRNREFVLACRYGMLARGDPNHAEWLARKDHAPERVVSVVKAVVDPLSVSGVGSVLAPFQSLAQGFLASLASSSAFDSMLPFMPVFPLRTRIFSTTTIITGTTVAEFAPKKVGSLSLSASDLDILKAMGQFVLSREVIEFGVEGTLPYLESQLRTAVITATDSQFLTTITSSATSFASSGSNANAARQDIRNLLQLINIGGASKLFLITTADIASAWATLGDSTGAQVFPNAVYNGGTIGGVRIVSSDSCPAQTIILADASQIAASQEGLRADASREATVQLDSTPDSPPTASTNLASLWQQNLVAVILERFFGAKVLTSGAVAVCTGANFTGGSPS